MAGAAKIIRPIKVVKSDQASILKRGLLLRLRHSRKYSLKVTSATFDSADGLLAKRRKVWVGSRGDRVVRLKLTGEGRRELSACAARTITVRSGKRRATTELIRNTAACGPKPVDLSRASECDWIGQQAGSRCSFPFPSDFHTVADPSSTTGRRVGFKAGSMPRNLIGTPIAPGDYDKLDGFSPGSAILLKVPGLDSVAAMQQAGAAPINHIGRYAEPNQPIVVIDAATGQRHPIWSEVDSNATSAANTGVAIHPATNFASGHRYIVAMQNLEDGERRHHPSSRGLPLLPRPAPGRLEHDPGPPSPLRVALQDPARGGDPPLGPLPGLGLHGRHMTSGSRARCCTCAMTPSPTWATPTSTTARWRAPAPRSRSPRWTSSRRPKTQRSRAASAAPSPSPVTCPPTAPRAGASPTTAGLPARNGDWAANFDCIVPRVAVDGPPLTPGGPPPTATASSARLRRCSTPTSSRSWPTRTASPFCATDEIGMSNSDASNTAAAVLPDLSNFPMLADRLHQGLLNGLFLGRLMIHPAGFASHVAFHADGATLGSPSVIDDTELYHEGSSQGGIFGGALTAIAPDFTKSVLNVPAMNYSVLLPRSIDYDPFSAIINTIYTDELSRPLLLSLVQMLWDRAEPNGYAHRMTTDPLPDTPPHKVLMNVAFGDHQVTNFQADVEARTIGAQTHLPSCSRAAGPTSTCLERPRDQQLPLLGIGDRLRRHRPDPPESHSAAHEHRCRAAPADQHPQPLRRGPPRRSARRAGAADDLRLPRPRQRRQRLRRQRLLRRRLHGPLGGGRSP